MEYCIVHYGEIALKGKNRDFFENALLMNIKKKLDVSIKKSYGYFVLSSKEKTDWNKLKYVPGISNFFVIDRKVSSDYGEIKEAVLDFAKDKSFDSFRITTLRNDKTFKKTSSEMDREIGELIFEKGKKVSLNNPDLNIYVIIHSEGVYISSERVEGVGGLPIGVTGKAICLLSGGIDSPVAAFLAMKRGLKIKCIHFKPKLSVNDKGEEKMEDLVRELSRFQDSIDLLVVDFSKIQEQIVMKVPSKYRMLIYRRFMVRIAEKFGSTLVLGDNLAQVASQTPENLSSVYSVSENLILSPLIGMDKNDIMKISRQIGTYETSIKEYPDCCSYLVPSNPELKATSSLLDSIEKELDIEDLVAVGTKNVEKIVVE